MHTHTEREQYSDIFTQWQHYTMSDCYTAIFYQMSSSLWCELDDQRLGGYCCACSGMLGRPLPKPISEEARLIDSIESIRMDNFEVT